MRLGYASRRAGASRPACRAHQNRDTTREVVMAGDRKPDKKVSNQKAKLNQWGQFRASTAVWTKLERHGDAIVLGEQSNHTATEMRRDYDLLYWEARQLNQWVGQMRETGGDEYNPGQPTLDEAKKAFHGTILVGDEKRVPYLTDRELQEQIAHQQAPSSFAERIVTKRWGFTDTTGKTYLRRKPKSKPAKD